MKFLRKNYILETVVIALFLAAFDFFLFPGSLIQWNPSPLWALVLLIAMRYGSPAGMIGGLAASAVHLWALTRGGYMLQDVLHRHPELLAGPVLYVLVGLFIGETRERLSRRAEYLATLAKDLGKQLDSSEIRRMEVERGHLEMEKRIAGQTDTLRGIYDNLNQLSTARTESELWEMTVDLMYREMRAESCAVWRLSPPELLALTGAAAPDIPPLAHLAARKRGIATAADWTPGPGRKAPGAELAGVVVADAGNPIVIVVSGMSFNRLNRNTSILFELMVQRTGTALEEIRRLDRLRRVTVDDPELGLSSESYLRNRIREQAMLSRRHGGELTLVRCGDGAAVQDRNLQERLSVVTACAIRSAARASDGIAYFPREKSFVVLLPGSNAAGGKVVIKKIMNNLELLGLKTFDGRPLLDMKWGVAEFDPQRGEGDMYKQLFQGNGKGAAAQ